MGGKNSKAKHDGPKTKVNNAGGTRARASTAVGAGPGGTLGTAGPPPSAACVGGARSQQGGHRHVDPSLAGANHMMVGNALVCSDFLGGYCRFGQKCHYKHMSIDEFAQATAFMELENERNRRRGGSGSGPGAAGGSGTTLALSRPSPTPSPKHSAPQKSTAAKTPPTGPNRTKAAAGSPPQASPPPPPPAAPRQRSNTATTTTGPRTRGRRSGGGTIDFSNIDPRAIFPTFPYKMTESDQIKMAEGKEDEDVQCAICFCNFEEGDLMMMLPCMHRFHADCAADWLKRKPTCPACSSDVTQTGSEFLTA